MVSILEMTSNISILSKQRIKYVIKRSLRSIPSKRIKHELSNILHKYKEIIRRELVLTNDDSVVIVGTPNQSRVHQSANLTDDKVLIIEPEPDNFNNLKHAASSYDRIKIDKRGV